MAITHTNNIIKAELCLWSASTINYKYNIVLLELYKNLNSIFDIYYLIPAQFSIPLDEFNTVKKN